MIDFQYGYTDLSDKFYSAQKVYRYPDAKLLIVNDCLAKDLCLDLEGKSEQELLKIFLGYTSKKPISQAYAGHQFGNFTMLGDGRAILLGEYEKPNGELVDFHLKGAGLTKFSRGGDGKAALAPMLREYIVSEAMHNLGIPTSRILAVISTGENIQRNKLQQGAIALRVASSHIRVGTFQYAAMLGESYNQELLDYTIVRHNIPYTDNKALSLLDYVIDKQTTLITQWERVGFIHGVMNTDNMTISGETIDYGPCAFMDIYDPDTVFSSIDRDGRYAFANQASIAGWNIARLAESLLKLISQDEDEAIKLAQDKLQSYSEIYKQKWRQMFLSKIGFGINSEYDDELISGLLIDMFKHKLDYTNTFYNLSYNNFDHLRNKGLKDWLDKYVNYDINFESMMKSNPVIIPRNHQVEKALEFAGNGNFSILQSLVTALETPYELNALTKKYMAEPLEQEKVRFTFCGT
ncbi:protein adenylyltransferase SelO [Francisella philomiragia]|uniref:protein adenylyltransferase SelO n=1 Tax=Francisella philomiragia TaxID=28110 RepID=UPI00190720DD|nr:YdiU family protein [Francisella philomiragia]MBK2093437.1 YdiU family protein [Francisella philomiragia]MBK2255907.1 YdiU family protein [Francisella philomiragia]MBK2268565.1 YdiU family protein [Francisella philomiragia]MBK2270960.1 YdiU family protein [Francisella philomiragia]MBK2274740.1 YdiU family protein [Francisella philomiragia]